MGDESGGGWPLRYLKHVKCRAGPQISNFLFRGGPVQETILPLQLLCVLPKCGHWSRLQFSAHHLFNGVRVGVVLQAG